MRKTIMVILIVVALVVVTTLTAFAGGDKVRGEKGESSADSGPTLVPID